MELEGAKNYPPAPIDEPNTKFNTQDNNNNNNDDGVRKLYTTLELIPSTSTITNQYSSPASLTDGFTFNWIETHLQFLNLIESCQRGIDRNVHPERISQGSSGSYYIKDESGKIVGVFKPKDEEPYGQLNPKWIKWLHRTCCPCLFGRSFLMPNTGYISEAAASLVDTFLGLEMVPRTQVAHLSSMAFVFPWWEHYKVWRERNNNPEARYPLKLGSFQLFVEGFESSSIVLSKLEEMRPLEPELRKSFQSEFERMTILDYVIRNTDRSMDNWLIHLSWCETDNDSSDDDNSGGNGRGDNDKLGHGTTARTSFSAMQSRVNVVKEFNQAILHTASEAELFTLKRMPRLKPRVKIACIDNGMAFPFKHPHEWRSYPYSWASLPEARMPYSKELCAKLLPLLTDTSNWELLIGRLRQIFQIDSDFNEKIFQRQMAILRGQIYNVVQSLQKGESPLQLIERPLLLIEEEDQLISDDEDFTDYEVKHSINAHRPHRHTPVTTRPFFSCW